ncbi:MAG TPA: DHA2 family efflux MFS transporter permease subunit [Polyangiaceae bacterium]|jgi:EmrB/QacA subfamily drug resistance transporter|nr:DHA2 family efflux MFS transporter permease subunit [Polyangiaceae bacterium]
MNERTATTEPEPVRVWPVFVVTSLGSFLVSLDLSIVNVAFPDMARTFPAASRAELAWVITAYSIVFGSLLVVGGRTGDRVGLRRVFFGGLAVFLLGSALCGIAPSVALLVAGRAIQGAGASLALPSSVGLLLAAVTVEKRSQMVALWGGVGALAVATGPSFGALLVANAGWRWVFYVNLPVGALAYVWGRKVLPRHTAPADAVKEHPDYLGALLLSLSVASITLAISEAGTYGFLAPRVLLTTLLCPLIGAAFVARSARHPSPVLDLRLFRLRTFRIANLATLFYAMGFFAMLLGNILFLTDVWKYPIERAGLAVTPGPLVVAVVSGFAGRAATRVGFRAILIPGSACFATGLLWFATRVGIEPAFLAEWLPGTLLVGLGIGLTFPVLSAAAVSSLPRERFGVGSAVNQTARQIGGAMGVAILIAILGKPHDVTQALSAFERVWTYAACMAALSGTVAILLGSAKTQRAEATLAADTTV